MPLEKRADVICSEVDGETLILDVRSSKIHHLNATASYIWNECDGQRSTVEIAETLAQHFEIDINTAKTDVERTVLQLTELNLFLQTE
jgi:methyltransferase-like protein